MSGPPGEPPEPLIPDRLDATLVLVRHGESEFIVEGRFQGQAETPLSPSGLRQAALVGERLAHPHSAGAADPQGPLREIVHSPLRRTTQTAEAIAATIAGGAGRAPHRSPASSRSGRAPGRACTGTRSTRAMRDVLAAWRRRPTEAWAPGGESLAEVQTRVRPALRGP